MQPTRLSELPKGARFRFVDDGHMFSRCECVWSVAKIKRNTIKARRVEACWKHTQYKGHGLKAYGHQQVLQLDPLADELMAKFGGVTTKP